MSSYFLPFRRKTITASVWQTHRVIYAIFFLYPIIQFREGGLASMKDINTGIKEEIMIY